MENHFKTIAGIVGDPVRATILWTLLGGKAFTATELALAADTSSPNISMHLAKLVQAGLLVVESQGRHRYYRFSRDEIAYAVEAMSTLIPHPAGSDKTDQPVMPAIKQCRTCYDHVAGKTGMAITDGLLSQRMMVSNNAGFDLSAKGSKWFTGMGIDIEALRGQRRILLRPCLDWSERRYHIGGSVAAALLNMMIAEHWIRKNRNSRAVVITAKGRKSIYDHLKLLVD